jgi:DNA polymerase III sliding clamp (beta) subunit (PCNA family)
MRLGYHRFPDWRKVVTPGGEQIRIHFSREEALGALESVGKEKDCSLLLSSQSVTVKAGNVTAAFEATVTQRPSDLREGSCEPIEVRMNPKLLVQALKAAETETLDVEMDWVGKQPSLMRFSSGDLFQVLMPLRR